MKGILPSSSALPGPASACVTAWWSLAQGVDVDHEMAGGSTRAQRGPPSSPVRSMWATRLPVSSAVSMVVLSMRLSMSLARRNISKVVSLPRLPEIDEASTGLAVDGGATEVECAVTINDVDLDLPRRM